MSVAGNQLLTRLRSPERICSRLLNLTTVRVVSAMVFLKARRLDRPERCHRRRPSRRWLLRCSKKASICTIGLKGEADLFQARDSQVLAVPRVPVLRRECGRVRKRELKPVLNCAGEVGSTPPENPDAVNAPDTALNTTIGTSPIHASNRVVPGCFEVRGTARAFAIFPDRRARVDNGTITLPVVTASQAAFRSRRPSVAPASDKRSVDLYLDGDEPACPSVIVT